MDFIFILTLLLSFFIATLIFKYVFNASTYFIFSMIKNENIARFIDKFLYRRFWTAVGTLGVFLGFGFLGIYYWYRDSENKWSSIIKAQLLVFILSLVFTPLLASTNIYLAIMFFVTFNLFGIAGGSLLLLIVGSIGIVINYFNGQGSCPGIAPVIPGVDIPGVPISIPFFEGWLAILIILTVHELAHGVLARIANINVKSFGLLMLGFFPIGAFTEPDENELKAASGKDQLRVYSAGAMANLILALMTLVLILVFSFFASSYLSLENQKMYSGVYISEFSKYTGICGEGELSLNYGAIDSNIDVTHIFGNEVYDVNSFVYYSNIAKDMNLGYAAFTFNKDGNVFDYNLRYNDDGKLGVMLSLRESNYDSSFTYSFLSFIQGFLYWLLLLNLMVALVNFLPSEPFDGGKMVRLILSPFVLRSYNEDQKSLVLAKIFGYLLLGLFIINLMPLFF